MATREQIRTAKTRHPFRPFRIALDGRSFVVRHPELVGCDVDGRALVVHDDDGMHFLEMRAAEIRDIDDEPSVG